MGMTDKQFNSWVSLILDDIMEVLEQMSEGKEKEKWLFGHDGGLKSG